MWQTGIKSQATDFGSPCNSILLKNVTFEHENLPFRIILAAHHATGIPRAGLEPRRLYNMVEFMVHTRAAPVPAPKQASARALAPCSAQWPWALARGTANPHTAPAFGAALPPRRSTRPAKRSSCGAFRPAPYNPRSHARARCQPLRRWQPATAVGLLAPSLSRPKERESALSPKRSFGLPVFKLA